MTNAALGELTPKQAWQLVQDDPRTLLVDIRSTMEYLFVSHPKGAVHVPWIDEPEWTENPHFVTDIRKLLIALDGDDTYPAADVGKLLEPVVSGNL